MSDPVVCGIVLAAGAGTRFGGPKALARTAEGVAWVARAVDVLREGGCARVVVALGAGADQALQLVPSDAEPIVVGDWAEGVAASLRAALAHAAEGSEVAAVILPVDTPDTPPEAVQRIIAAARSDLDAALVRAVYLGTAGHPVLIGRSHWAAVEESVSGDQGAGPYLSAHGALRVECADLWSGADIDSRPTIGQ